MLSVCAAKRWQAIDFAAFAKSVASLENFRGSASILTLPVATILRLYRRSASATGGETAGATSRRFFMKFRGTVRPEMTGYKKRSPEEAETPANWLSAHCSHASQSAST
ncbi:hypothetical protein SBA3_2360002 [Candidatus Sulfopaludibacter sp. SbA3]|nr:hypothetical protein SBA3_2360002 [Candidatus Sulfopaludibacter sp. SbA3]